jgi:DNA-binding PadR family transcriptional regulator
MKVGAVSLWLLLLLSEKPMYGYEIIRELEKRFAGYWKPKTGTIYPALERLEENKLVTSRVEFREEAPRPQALRSHRERPGRAFEHHGILDKDDRDS